ncbi:MAG: rhodanese-like domain-containing protein [Myxococcota bacterium]
MKVRRLYPLLVVVVAALQVACSHSSAAPVDPTPVTAQTLAEAVVIDVRTPAEHAEGHLAGDSNLPVDELEARRQELDVLTSGDRARPIVVYCRSGRRAAKAKGILEGLGYTNVTNGGGLSELQRLQNP